MHSKNTMIGLLALCTMAGCGSSGKTPDPTRELRGKAALSTFPATPKEILVVGDGGEVARAALKDDGSFALTIPKGRGYQLVFTNETGVGLVFPRSSGSLQSRFDVLGAGPAFELGAVRYIGDPTAQSYSFYSTSSSGQADGECEDGVDPMGAVCVDDDDEEGASCEAENDGGVDCVDGVDPATGLECDGGPDANADSGEAETVEPALPSEAAVAEHNLPSALGCASEDDDGVNCEDGIDPATGLECDGGPAANGNGAD